MIWKPLLKTSKKQNYNLISSQNLNMQFGKDKYDNIYNERGKKVSLGRKFSANNIELNKLENGYCYKYL